MAKKCPQPPDVPDGFEHVVFDLDNTLAKGCWPSPHVGEPIPEGVALLRHYVTKGYAIIIYTARPASHAPRIWEWLHHHNLHWYIYDVVTDKPNAGLFIDDRSWRPPYVEAP